MKVAKASENDIEMALKLCRWMDAIEDGQMPSEISIDPEMGEEIDTDEREQFDRLMTGLKNLLGRGSLFRVVLGMAALIDPENKLVDPNSSVLDLHPDIVKAVEQRDELLSALIESRNDLQFANDSPGGGIYGTIWMTARQETLFEFMDLVISKGVNPLVEQNQQVAEAKAIVAESVRKGADYLKQLKADAARYRWLRRNDREEIDEFMTNEGALDIVFVCDGQGSASKICEAELDAAIDKKIKAEKGGAA